MRLKQVQDQISLLRQGVSQCRLNASHWRNRLSQPHFSDWLFWQSMESFWQSDYGRSPWRDWEIRQDWDYGRFETACNDLGLEVYSAGGYCPVQVEASLCGGKKELYFRARGNSWSCEIFDAGEWDSDQRDIELDGTWGMYDFAAGYMPYSKVFGFIEKTVRSFTGLAIHDQPN